jgi:glutaredoxin 3
LILERKGIDYNAISITRDEAAYQEMIEKSGSQRVPQVFIDGKLIGGFDELYTLERSGELDRLLEQV